MGHGLEMRWRRAIMAASTRWTRGSGTGRGKTIRGREQGNAGRTATRTAGTGLGDGDAKVGDSSGAQKEDGARMRLDREDERFSKNFERRLCRRLRLVVPGACHCWVARLRGSPPNTRYIYLPTARLILLLVSPIRAAGFPLVALRLFVLSSKVYFPFPFLSLGAAPSRNN